MDHQNREISPEVLQGYQIARDSAGRPGRGQALDWEVTVGVVPAYSYAKRTWLRTTLAILWQLLGLLPFGGLGTHSVWRAIQYLRVERQYERWMRERAESEEPYITGLMNWGDVHYPIQNDDGKWVSAREPVVQIYGLHSPLKNADMVAYRDAVLSLATTLGRINRQTRVYATTGLENFILQAKDGDHWES